ncbi:MAG: DUF411 domain-containing protein [bacterium]
MNYKNIIIGIAVIAVIIVGVVLIAKPNQGDDRHTESTDKKEIMVYHSPTCGCCHIYVSYLKREGYEVEVENMTDLSSIKEKYQIPNELGSCHTAVIEDYVVEGHVPAEAIEKLLAEKPDIGGIALPGMPGGSPGMGGIKRGPFSVHMIGHGGEDLGVFVEI